MTVFKKLRKSLRDRGATPDPGSIKRYIEHVIYFSFSWIEKEK